jgi:hypothetical protein
MSLIPNSVSAISAADVECAATFLKKVIQLVLASLSLDSQGADDVVETQQVVKGDIVAPFHKLYKVYVCMMNTYCADVLWIAQLGADIRIKEHLLSLYVLYVQPFSSQEVTKVNLYDDVELPSGLSCIGTAMCIIDLYKQ